MSAPGRRQKINDAESKFNTQPTIKNVQVLKDPENKPSSVLKSKEKLPSSEKNTHAGTNIRRMNGSQHNLFMKGIFSAKMWVYKL